MPRMTMLLLALCLSTTPALAQTPEAEVVAAVKRTFDAFNKRDTTALNSYFVPTARGFWMDNGVLQGDDDLTAPGGSEEKPSVNLRHLSVRVYGNTAVVVGYIEGTIYVGTQARHGTWRFTETRVKDANVWKVVQYHFSALQPTAQ